METACRWHLEQTLQLNDNVSTLIIDALDCPVGTSIGSALTHRGMSTNHPTYPPLPLQNDA